MVHRLDLLNEKSRKLDAKSMTPTRSVFSIEVTEYEQTAEDDKDIDNRHEQRRHLRSTCQR